MNQKTNQQPPAAAQAAAAVAAPAEAEALTDIHTAGQYRVLANRALEQIVSIEDAGRVFLEHLDYIASQGTNSRELSLARTNAEQAVMWAVKHVTK